MSRLLRLSGLVSLGRQSRYFYRRDQSRASAPGKDSTADHAGPVDGDSATLPLAQVRAIAINFERLDELRINELTPGKIACRRAGSYRLNS